MKNVVTSGVLVERSPLPPTLQDWWQHPAASDDDQTENRLIEHYLPLVRSVLARLAMTLPAHVDQDDLHSAGLVGLLQALRHFDHSCNNSFESYARLRIRGAMLDELRRMDWVPRSVHEKARRIQQAMNQLEQQLGRVPSDAEVARALRLSLAEYNHLLNEVRPATFVCLDAVCDADGSEGSNVCELIPDPQQDGPMEQAYRAELNQIISERIKMLPANQKKVLALYYGEGLRLREIAEAFGVTESRICQIHSQAILSIRAYLHKLEAEPATQSVGCRK